MWVASAVGGCERAVAPLLVASVLARCPQEQHDPHDDAQQGHDAREDQDLGHDTTIIPDPCSGQTGAWLCRTASARPADDQPESSYARMSSVAGSCGTSVTAIGVSAYGFTRVT